MVFAFMVYALITAALLGVAALVVEHSLRQFGYPIRWGWVTALTGAVALPAIFMFAPQLAVEPATVFGVGFADTLWNTAAPIAEAGTSSGSIETGLQIVWMVLSGVGLIYLVLSAVRLHLASRSWRLRVVAGCPVLVSENVGPAVVGFSSSWIVLPRWALGAEGRIQKLMLAHEQEHVRARDPLLLAFVVAALIVMPWNAPLWWIAQRLRVALEIDCDARVIRAAPFDVRLYGDLLLEVGRRVAGPELSAVSFSHPRSPLEHRIRAMTTKSVRKSRFSSAVGAVGVVMASVAFVWAVPHPIFGFCSESVAVGERATTTSGITMYVTAGPLRVIKKLPASAG